MKAKIVNDIIQNLNIAPFFHSEDLNLEQYVQMGQPKQPIMQMKILIP